MKKYNKICPKCGSSDVERLLGTDNFSYCHNCRYCFESEQYIEPEELEHILPYSSDLEEFIKRKDEQRKEKRNKN